MGRALIEGGEGRGGGRVEREMVRNGNGLMSAGMGVKGMLGKGRRGMGKYRNGFEMRKREWEWVGMGFYWNG